MTDVPDPDRHKAVLAAVLAVQRGFLSPDEAVRVLADLPSGESDTAMQTLLSVAPTSAKAEIENEIEQLAGDAGKQSEALTKLGMDAEQQSTLFSLKPTEKTQLEQAISSVAQSDRVRAMTSRLPSATGTGRYTVKREFARGGMGKLFVALDNAVGREVALKELIDVKQGSQVSSGGPEMLERFLREAKVTGQLEHPNIVPVYEIATRDDGSVFYTMKLVRGKTMAHRLQKIKSGSGSDRQKLDERLKLLDAFVDVCNAVAYAHSRGVIHRDLKPANIMLGDFGETLVLDWGLARVHGQEDSSSIRKKADGAAFSPSLMQEDSDNRTLNGAILGTPAYMPPEQARGEMDVVDERADIYALGAILFEILSGNPPYKGSNARDVLAKVLVLEPEPLSEAAPLAPPDLVTLTEKAMARDAAERVQSAKELGTEVLAFRDGRTLSVYRYSTGELVSRFIRRHKAAVTVASVALILIMAGALVSFDNIAEQRDEAQLALEAAETERTQRVKLEEKQQRERDRLIEKREQVIATQRDYIDSNFGTQTTSEARTRIQELRRRGQTSAARTEEDRNQNTLIVQNLLEASNARGELIRLITEPVAGRSHQFVPPRILEEERDLLRELRLLASELAQANEDFALAEVIVRGTDLPAAELDELVTQIEMLRTGLLRAHADNIAHSLEDVRSDLGRSRLSYKLEDYVLQLSGYREQQTVDLLGVALQPFIDRAATSDEPLFWTQPERDEITLICRVLAHLELPEATVPVLAELMGVIDDDRLTIECGVALCVTGHWRAWQPLVDARARLGEDTYAWQQISERAGRVPEPANMPAATTVAELLDRAGVRFEFGNGDGAVADIEAALELAPDSPQALVARGSLMLPMAESKALERSHSLYTRAVELDDGFARAYLLRAHTWWRQGEMQLAIKDARKAIELAPDEWRHYSRLGFLLQMNGQYAEAIEANTTGIELYPWSSGLFANRAGGYISIGEYDKALDDCNRALDLNPRFNEAWINRGVIKNKLGLYEGAVNDLTRLLEISPGHAWGHINRGEARMSLEDYAGAIDDFDRVLATHAGPLYVAFVYRARCHKAEGNHELAIADCKSFLEIEREGEIADEARAMIAELTE